MPITFTNIGLAEPSTITNRVGAVTIARGTTNEQQEILVIGDGQSSLGLAVVTDIAPVSTAFGLVVREAAPTTIVAVSSVSGLVTLAAASTGVTVTPAAGSTFNTRPLQSSAADLQVTATPAAGSTFNVRALQSSAADLQVTASQNSTATWSVLARTYTSSGGGVEGSTATPLNGVFGLHIRQVMPTLLSTGRSTAGNNSTSLALVTSVAGQRVHVFAYSITSTVEAVNDVSFYSSAASLLWPIQLASFSSGIAGANLAVTPPAYLFRTDVAAALNFNVTGTTGTYKVGVSYFQQA